MSVLLTFGAWIALAAPGAGSPPTSWLTALHPFLSLMVVLNMVRPPTPDALPAAGWLTRLWLCYPHYAYLCWTLEGDCPELGPVFVDQVHRQAGLGGVLLRHALQEMKQHGKAQVKVIAGPDRVAFYERAGFAVTARFCRAAAADLESTAAF